jgi:hypothetical protein
MVSNAFKVSWLDDDTKNNYLAQVDDFIKQH